MVENVEIPKALKSRPKDRRGYPIPFTVAIMKDGTPDFRVVDQIHMSRALRKGLCGLSGEKLRRSDGAVLIGGPLSAFAINGAYLDPPMRPECAEYALCVCPYLALPRYVGKEFREIGGGFEGAIVEHTAAEKGRPPVFVAVHCDEWSDFGSDGSHLFKPKMPYRAVSFWQHGRMLTYEEARSLSSEIPAPDVLGVYTRTVEEPPREISN